MKVLLTLFAILVPAYLFSQYQTPQEKPTWVSGYFSEQPNSYIEVVTATGYNEDDARSKAAQQIVERRSLATGQRNTINIQGGNITVNGRDDLTVKSRIIDQYTEYISPGEYRVSLLTQTAKNPTLQFEPVEVTNKYKFSPRVFVPGMAQIHKGQTLKGALFILGEIIAVGGAIAFEGLRASYNSKAKSTHNVEHVKKYISDANNMKNIRDGFIVGSVAIYVWNVLDGIIFKGKKHVEVGKTQFSFSPYSNFDSAGLLFTYSF